MIDDNRIKNITVSLVKKSFYQYFSEPKTDTKHILLDRLFPEERRISSTISGLQTSLGLFWERITESFAQENGFEVLNKQSLQRPSIQPETMTNLIERIKTQRQNQGGDLTQLRMELDQLYEMPYNGDDLFISMQKGKGADVILKKNNIVYIYDIKTVQVNANNGNSLNETVILWICYYKYQHRLLANNIQAKLVFPYNSSNENNDQAWWGEFGGRISPLTRNEVNVGNEFWEFITGNNNALNAMIAGFDEVSEDNDFITFFKQVFECSTPEELKEFSLKVKIRATEEKHKVKLVNGQVVNTRKKLSWSHLNLEQTCTFKSRINALLNEDQITCTICNNQLGQ